MTKEIANQQQERATSRSPEEIAGTLCSAVPGLAGSVCRCAEIAAALLSAEQRGREAGIGEAAREAEKGGCDCHFAPCPHDDAGRNIAWSIRALLSAEPKATPSDPSARVLELEKEKLELTQALRAALYQAGECEMTTEGRLLPPVGHPGDCTKYVVECWVCLAWAALVSGNAPRTAAAPTSPSAAATEEAK